MSLSDAYRTSAYDFIAVVESLPESAREAKVPACPDWSVADLLRHQAGATTDLLAGNMAGAGGDGWTARQVEPRRKLALDEVITEWQANLEAVAAQCDTMVGPNPAWDITVHLADLREAAVLDPLPPEHGWGEVLVVARAAFSDQTGTSVSVAESEADPETTTWHFATTYGLWRAMFSRLDPADLQREILRGDADAFRAAAFLSD